MNKKMFKENMLTRFNRVIGNFEKARDVFATKESLEETYQILQRIKTSDIEFLIESEIIRSDPFRNQPLSTADIQALNDFNDKLSRFQKHIRREANSIVQSYKERSKPLDCFHVEINVEYYLDNKDPLYLEETDNVLAKRNYWYNDSDTGKDDMLDDSTICGNSQHTELPFPKQYYCRLFLDISDGDAGHYRQITLRDILRIGFVLATIEVHYALRLPIRRRRNMTVKVSS
jgi:hypothetical protein